MGGGEKSRRWENKMKRECVSLCVQGGRAAKKKSLMQPEESDATQMIAIYFSINRLLNGAVCRQNAPSESDVNGKEARVQPC